MSMHETPDNQSAPKEGATSKRKEIDAAMSDADYAAHVDSYNAAVKARNGVAERECGECTACCTVLAVAELNKPAYQACAHECGGCGIYNSRPRACRAWCCSWLFGRIEGDERRRPDKLGLLFTREGLAEKPITVAYEVWPGAGRELRNDYLLRKMSQKIPIVLRDYQTKNCTVITPDAEKRQYISQLIQSDWYATEITQVVVTNSPTSR